MGIVGVAARLIRKGVMSPEARKSLLKQLAKDPGKFDRFSKALGGLTDDEMRDFVYAWRRQKYVKQPVKAVEPPTTVPPTTAPPVEPPGGYKIPDQPGMVVEKLGKPGGIDLAGIKLGAKEIPNIEARLLLKKAGVTWDEKLYEGLTRKQQRTYEKGKVKETTALTELALEKRETLDDASTFLGFGYITRVAKQLVHSGIAPKARRIIAEEIPDRLKTGLTALTDYEPRRIVEVFSSKTFPLIKGFSPHYLGRRVYGMLNNPVEDAIRVFVTYVRNTARDTLWLNKLLGIGRVGTSATVPDSAKLIAKESAKVLTEVSTPYQASIKAWKLYEGAKATALKQPSQANTKALADALKRYKDLEAQWLPQWEELMNGLANSYADTRIYLGAMYYDALRMVPTRGVKDPVWFIRGKLNLEEQKITTKIRQFFDKRGAEAERMGLNVIKGTESEGSYIPFLWKKHLTKELPKSVEKSLGANYDIMREYLNFMARANKTKTWMPSARAALKYYVPTINKKLSMQTFHDKWHKHVNQLKRHPRNVQDKAASAWWDAWFTNTVNREMMNWKDKAINQLVNWDYLRLIGLNPAVAFKHLLKMAGTPIEHGFIAYGKGVASTGRLICQYLKQRAGKKLGIKSWEDGFYGHLVIGEHFLTGRAILQSMLEMPGMAGMMRNWRLYANFPTSAVELLDRGVNMMAALHAGAAHGASFHTVKRQIIASIMDVNFLGGFDQPLLFRTPIQRMIFMFQSTPLKIFERHVKATFGTADDIKQKIIGRSLAGINTGKLRTDMYGTTMGAKTIRGLLIIGSIGYVSKEVFDSNTLQWMIHWPFFTHTPTGTYAPTLSPYIKTVTELHKGDPWYEVLRDNVLYMGIVDKFKRIATDEIPTMYEDNPWRYLISTPKYSTQLDMQEYKVIRNKVDSMRRHAYRATPVVTELYNLVMDNIDDYITPSKKSEPDDSYKPLW